MERTDICKLCYEDFSDQRRPRGLHCGHSYCTDCLDELFDNGNLSCPKCKRNHQVSSARDFSINYDLEECLLDARKAKASIALASHSSTKINKMQTMTAEQKTFINNLMASAEDIRFQLEGYDEFLLNRKVKHEAVLQKIRELGILHEALVEEINEERKRIMDVQREGDGYCKDVNDKLTNLENSANDKTATVAVADIIECLVDFEEWIEQCQQNFPYQKITFAEQILTKSLDALLLVDLKTDEEEVPTTSAFTNNDLKIMEKLAEIDEIKLTLDKLRDKPEHWRKRIAEGQVYAVDSSNGRKRSAVLSERNGNIYMHYLQDREAPVLAYTIEQSEVVKSLNKDSTVVFLDLGWDGSFKGRVHILLSPDTPLARHFRILCTGDLGPSYAHSKFFRYYDNPPFQYLVGGDYEYNNGSGGAPIMEGLDRNKVIYIRQNEQGSVGSANENQLAQFGIMISNPSCKCKVIFAKVIDGIEVLIDATRFVDINEVEIINCGVQLPL